jgi:hypothetical protein
MVFLLLCINVWHIFPEESEQRTTKEAVIDGLIGSAEALLVNGVVMVYDLITDKVTGRTPWAIPTAETLRLNFTTPWIWEEDIDDFIINQLGHSTQALFYFSAGRANRFGFYESVLFSVLGSFTFEALGEDTQASINDFITTVGSSMVGGEIFYRLYLEACAAGIPAPIAFFINPMAGFHRLISGWKPPNYGRNLYQLRADIGMGYAKTYSPIALHSPDEFRFQGLLGGAGLSVVYGNPFEQDSKVPFQQFELTAFYGRDIWNYMDIRILTDGYLFSSSPVYTDTDKMSTGLSLHLDLLCLGQSDPGQSTVNLYSNALDWTFKYQHLFSQNTALSIKFHLGFTYMGASEFFSPERGEYQNNFGAGLNNKILFGLDNTKWGKLELSVFNYGIWVFPGTGTITNGFTYWLYAEIAYYYFITKKLSIGIADTFVIESGIFGNYPDTRKHNNEARLFVSWNL